MYLIDVSCHTLCIHRELQVSFFVGKSDPTMCLCQPYDSPLVDVSFHESGKPKGCVSSLQSLQHYIRVKNLAHNISSKSTVLLASAITFE